jgi:hypothetical protein
MAYKVFTNGSPLPASDLNTYLMNQSVMVFADSTARDAALTAPTEGMCVYLENNNHFQIYTGSPLAWHTQNPISAQGDLIIGNSNGHPSRLAIGTSGQALLSNGTTATWGVPSSTPTYQTWTLLASGSLPTGVGSFSLTGFAARDNYFLGLTGVSQTAAASNELSIRINGDSSNHQGYQIAIRGLSSYSAGIVNNSANSNIIIGRSSTNAGSVFDGGVVISGARNTSGSVKMLDFYGAFGASGGNSNEAWLGKGYYDGSGAVTSILIRNGGVGNNFDSGQYVLYGSD